LQLYSNSLTKIIPNCSNKKKRWICKPDSVPQEAPIIYLLQPTPRQRTSSPWLPVYLALQETVRTPDISLYTVVGSYPAFSPLPLSRRLFSVTNYLRLPPAVISTESCSALSGLSSLLYKRRAIERSTEGAKIK